MRKYVLKFISGVPAPRATRFCKNDGKSGTLVVQYANDRAVEDHIIAQLHHINVLFETLICTVEGDYRQIEVRYYQNCIADALIARLAQADGVCIVILKNALNH